MLSAQFLLHCSRPSHPSHQVVLEPPGRRCMKSTLASKHSDCISPHLMNGVADPILYRQSLRAIHSDAIQRTIASLDANPLLGIPPPPINNYKVLTRRGLSAICPECLLRRHTVPHLFNWDATPTDLTLVDMWNIMILVMDFLVTLPSFSCLEPNVPCPPPEPPP